MRWPIVPLAAMLLVGPLFSGCSCDPDPVNVAPEVNAGTDRRASEPAEYQTRALLMYL